MYVDTLIVLEFLNLPRQLVLDLYTRYLLYGAYTRQETCIRWYGYS
jgi:hypothetical protein